MASVVVDGWMDATVAVVATGDLFVSVELALAVTHLFHLFLLLPFNLAIFAKLIPDPLQSSLVCFFGPSREGAFGLPSSVQRGPWN